MKDISEDYIEQEEATKKKPVELYHIWRGDGDQLNVNAWYYTSGDVTVPFDCGDGEGEQDYLPATLQRSLVKYDAQLEVTKCTISAAYLENPALEFIAINPIEILWIKIMRLHRDMDPLEADVVFIGQINTVSFQGISASIECVGFEKFLAMPVPIFRYQENCNWKLFEIKPIGGFTFGCLLVKALYKVGPTVIALDPTTKTQLTSAAFDDFDDDYFTLGFVEFGDEFRTIIDHEGDTITIAYPFRDLENDDEVDIYPGCDGKIETCRDKFLSSNIVHFFGFPFTPEENAATRVSTGYDTSDIMAG